MTRRGGLVLLFVVAVAAACATASAPTTTTCSAGQTACGPVCVNVQNDSDNCGKCGAECPLAQACVNGTCTSTCPGTVDVLCGVDAGKPACTDTQTDNLNCGGCGKRCPAGEVCHGGNCSGSCASSETKCTPEGGAPYCTDLKTDNANCGACGAPCGPEEVCSAGMCASACDTDQTLCTDDAGTTGYCANLQTDNANCGNCGMVCSGLLQFCSNGACASQCAVTQTLCTPDGGPPYCANTLSDNANCGSCGNVCPTTKPFCSGGTCSNGSVRVLICGAPSTASWNTDIQTKLQATGAFATVDVLACNTTTPSVATLQGYQAVLVYSDSPSFADTTTLGNNLATYQAAGGYVVVATFANASIALGGTWASGGYNLIAASGQQQPAEASALIILDNTSPLVTGVSKLTATSGYQSTGGVANGGVAVAEWGGGTPLIVKGAKNGFNRAELNFFPPSSTVRSDFWTGDGATIMKNALLYR